MVICLAVWCLRLRVYCDLSGCMVLEVVWCLRLAVCGDLSGCVVLEVGCVW